MTTIVQCDCGRAIPETAVEALLASPASSLECSICKRKISYSKVAKVIASAPPPVLDPSEINRIITPTSLASIGAGGVLDESDLADFNAATQRVARLMADGREYDADDIKEAAGEPGSPASEGLRRMRDLRKIPRIAILVRKKSGTKRTFLYRLVRLKPGEEHPSTDEDV